MGICKGKGPGTIAHWNKTKQSKTDIGTYSARFFILVFLVTVVLLGVSLANPGQAAAAAGENVVHPFWGSSSKAATMLCVLFGALTVSVVGVFKSLEYKFQVEDAREHMEKFPPVQEPAPERPYKAPHSFIAGNDEKQMLREGFMAHGDNDGFNHAIRNGRTEDSNDDERAADWNPISMHDMGWKKVKKGTGGYRWEKMGPGRENGV